MGLCDSKALCAQSLLVGCPKPKIKLKFLKPTQDNILSEKEMASINQHLGSKPNRRNTLKVCLVLNQLFQR